MLARVAAAVGAGVLLYVSFPPRPFWWLALPALAVLGLLVYGRRAKAAFGYGFLFGMGFLLPLLTWIMFLKFLDDLELQREEEGKLAGTKFRPAIAGSSE